MVICAANVQNYTLIALENESRLRALKKLVHCHTRDPHNNMLPTTVFSKTLFSNN